LAGASPFLKDDGLVGPVTLAAIKKFQDRNFSWSDSRVDPNNKSALEGSPGISHLVDFARFPCEFVELSSPAPAIWLLGVCDGGKLGRQSARVVKFGVDTTVLGG